MASTLFRILWPKRAKCIRDRSKTHARSVGAATLLASLIAGDAERAPTASVKAGVQRDKFVLASVETRELHCAFDRLGAAVSEKGLGEPVGGNLCDLFGEVGNRLHMVEIRRAVHQLIELRLRRCNHARMVMPGVHHRNSRKAVEILSALIVPDGCAAGMIDHDWRNRFQEAGHHVVFVFLNSVRHECLSAFLREPWCSSWLKTTITTKVTKTHEEI